MKTIPLTLALLTGALSAATPQNPAGVRPPPAPPIPPMLAIFDADRDGVISAEEIKNAADVLGKLDRNGDGKITPEEMHPPRPEGDQPATGGIPQGPPPQGTAPQGTPSPGTSPQTRPQGTRPQGMPPQGQPIPHGPPPPVISALDTDANGVVSAEELKKAGKSLKQLDKNGDGELSIQELLQINPPPPRDGATDNQRRPQGPPPAPADGPEEPPTAE